MPKNCYQGNYYAPLVLLVYIVFSSLVYAQNNTTNSLYPEKSTKSITGKITRDSNHTNKPIKFTKPDNKVIVFVWDGLRRDVITEKNTPNLYKLKQNGTFFSDHHSSYPTVTMNNANSLATGNYSGSTGFYGNRVWRPDAVSKSNNPQSPDFKQPVYTQKHDVLSSLDQPKDGKPLMYVETLFQVARKYGLKTAQVGKPGPVALQDAQQPTGDNVILTGSQVFPVDFAKKLQKKGYTLPKDALELYTEDELKQIGKFDPTKKSSYVELSSIDGTIPLIGLSDPKAATDALGRQANEYLMDIFLKEILPDYNPDLSIVWLSSPDTSSHKYGPGTVPFYKSLANQDKLLGKLILYMDKLGLTKNTNLLIVSDHGHSSISGDTSLFPLRDIKNGSIGEVSNSGYSVSGHVRVADMLTAAGFKAFDGRGCEYNPVLSGMLEDRKLLNPIKVDQDGSVCQEGPGRLYTSKSYKVPNKLPKNAVIIANNGGSIYFYVPDNDRETVKKLVRFLQSNQEFDSVFLDSKYGDLPGTLPLRKVQFYDSEQERHPDVLVSMSYDDKQVVQGLPGTIYSSSELSRGSHGSLSPVDIQNTFIAFGPNFKSKYTNILPTANVDLPVTIAYLLNLPFNNKSGRAVLEAIKGSGIKASDYKLNFSQFQPKQPATNLKIQGLASNNDSEYLSNKDSYTFVLNTKQLDYNGKKYNYIDSGKAVRY